MTVYAHLKEGDFSAGFPKISGNSSGFNGSNMSGPEDRIFGHFMGTFLLRRARYFSETSSQPPSVAVQGELKII
jgi:hypothetical protein